MGDVDISNAVISMVLKHVERCAGQDGVDAVIRVAGETRPVDVLHDLTAWSSWEEGRAILESAEAVLGGDHPLLEVGTDWVRAEAPGEITTVLQSLGSTEAVLEAVMAAAARYSPHVRMAPVEIAERWGVVDAFATPGYARYRAFCDYTAGVLGLAPTLFGLEPAAVEETQCTLRGDDRCRYHVAWSSESTAAATERLLRDQLALLLARFDAFKATASDLVAGEDLEVLLEKITARATTAVRAAGFVLAVDLPDLGQRVHGSGMAQEQIDAVVDRLLDPAAELPSSWLVVDVASGRSRYGRLTAIFPEGTTALPHERSLLRSYAGLAAAALDAATALERARRERATAEALLGLANDLASVRDRIDVAQRLARAVPTVVGCERSAVFLYEPLARSMTCAAVHGVDPTVVPTIVGFEVSTADVPHLASVLDEPRPQILSLDTAGPFLQGLMETGGVERVLVVPLTRLGRLYGLVAAAVADAAPTIDGNADVFVRLQGLADQAVTALENVELIAEASHRAVHDPLTGLPNRLVLHDKVRMAQGRTPDSAGAALLFVDLDNFKTINDSLGHTAGDRALVEAARRLSGCVRPRDTVVRLGGDEFAVLLPGASGADAIAVADRMLQALAEPFELEGHVVPLHASIGITDRVGDDADADDPLRNADMAMYVAKAAGKRQHATFDPAMHSTVVARLEVASALEIAVRDQLEVHYQPLLDPNTGRIGALEALVRWRHPEQGLLSPAQFLPVARDVGLARTIDSWVLQTAVRRSRAWQERWPDVRIGVTVNVSPDHLDARLVSEIAALLAETGLEPARLVLEVTEDRSVVDLLAARSVLDELQVMGVRTALDDFGTGYSALVYLEQLPVDFVKIDGELAGRAAYEPRSAALVAGVVDICRKLGVRTVAEGVETDDQLAFVTALGVDYVQGYLFARALPVDEAEAMIETWLQARLAAPA